MSARSLPVTDRAFRYRANQVLAPDGRCSFCGTKRNVGIDHIDGHEEHGEPQNLMRLCKSCNARKAVAMQRAGLGRLTRQYNPGKRSGGARTMGQWVLAVLSAKGESDAMSVSDAVEMIKATPQSRREEFASEIWRRRRGRGTDKTGVPF